MFSLTFDSEHEYEQWFEEKCESMRTSLSVLRSSTVGATTTRYFVCNRSGGRESKARNRVKASRKDIRHCSCHLVLRSSADGKVSVSGCFGHVGHKIVGNPAVEDQVPASSVTEAQIRQDER